MNAFFVAFVVLGSALSAQSACTFPYGGDGGVLENGAYKPGSVLAWCDVADNSQAFVNDEGSRILNQWYAASQQFDRHMQQANETVNSQGDLWKARNCFCDVKDNIVGNDGLATYYGSVCNDFGKLLVDNDFVATNNFMLNAYKQFNDYICNFQPQ